MIINFNLQKVLYFYKTGALDPAFINHHAVNHLDKWVAFQIELIRMHQAVKHHGQKTALSYSWVDRTLSVPSVLDVYISPDQLIPTGPPSSYDYLDICLARARQLLDTNRHINVLWSGGVDSTVALCSLLHQAQHRDQISVLCTFESILESGSLFDSVIKKTGVRIKLDQTRCDRHLPWSHDHEDPDQLYITGQCGDHMFGPPGPWIQPLSVYTRDRWWENRWWEDPWDVLPRAILDIVEPSLAHCPRPIETVRDMRWWILFNYCWLSPLYNNTIDKPASIATRIRAFYATEEFQRWTMHTPTYYEHRDQYRWPAKNVLTQLIDCKYYTKHKKKVVSMVWTRKFLPFWYMTDQNFKHYYIDN